MAEYTKIEWTEHKLTKAKKLQSVFYKGFGQDMCFVGKKEAGRLLDGLEYNEMPDTFYKKI
jgi:protein gp37